MQTKAPRIGYFELIDRFAVGGAAEIYRARDVRSGDVVVIKRLRPEKEHEPSLVNGFMREMELSLQMKHKNLIHGIDWGTHNGSEYAVLEFVDGVDLSRVVARAASRKIRIPLEFSLYIVREILDGLHYAHGLQTERGDSVGLVHRDLNPRNVFISYDGRIRVADFGASLATLLELPPEEVVGSPGYLSPEQARLEPLDCRSDIFAAGCILFELVTNLRAFDTAGKKDATVLKMHQSGEIRPVPRDVTDDVKRIIEKACALTPQERYEHAAQMREALDAVLRTQRSSTTELAIAALTRNLFKPEFQASRLQGSPLTF
jgi:serine/threonine-protein kinase